METQLFDDDGITDPEWVPVPVPDPQHGLLFPHIGDRLTYTPFEGFEGDDTFFYRVRSRTNPSCVADAQVTTHRRARHHDALPGGGQRRRSLLRGLRRFRRVFLLLERDPQQRPSLEPRLDPGGHATARRGP